MWDERYNTEQYLYGKMPNDFLMSVTGSIPDKGKVLCLADGEGRNSVFLARMGFDVTGIDYSKVATEKAKKLATESNVKVNYLCEDLANYDIGVDCWDAIVSIFCHLPEELRKIVYKKSVAGLKANGVFIQETYVPRQLALGTGGPQDLDMLPPLQTLQIELEGLEWKTAQEVDRIIMEGNSHCGASAVAQLVGIKK